MPFCQIHLKAPKPLPTSYPKEIKTLGDHLRKKRLDQGLLQKDVARHLGVSTDSVRLWEGNRKSPKLPYIPKILEFLGYSPNIANQTPGEKLKTFRTTKGLTQKAFAQILGVDLSTLSKWEGEKGRLPEGIWDCLKFFPN